MCGIAGILDPNMDPAQRKSALLSMMNALAHRGPDASGDFHLDSISLGHRRLSILDLSEAGRQPMQSADGRLHITYNGEIYNFQEVREQLKEYPFRTRTDTEVILAAWTKWGSECLHRFNGMFAFALWDVHEQTLFLCRDRLGIKPLYYHLREGGIIFASELRALIASGKVKPAIPRDALVSFLVHQTVHAPDTLIDSVKMLLPGQIMQIREGKIQTQAWWSPYSLSAQTDADPRQVKNELRRLMSEAVRMRTVSDVPVGAFLSGGIDSSAVVALLAETSTQPVDTFSLVFREPEYDESQWSGMIAKRFATRHHPLQVKAEDFLHGLPDALAALDHPSADGVNSWVVSGLTRKQGIKVALSGLGGDELFCGYPVFRAIPSMQDKRWIWSLPSAIRKAVSPVFSIWPGGRRGNQLSRVLNSDGSSLPQLYPHFRNVYFPEEAMQMLGQQQGWTDPVRRYFSAEGNRYGHLPLLSQISMAEIRNYTQDILLRDTDQMSMAHALEVRVPFFDYRLVEAVLRIPDSLKFPHTPKQLLVSSLGDLLPDAVVHRPKKGFFFPWEKWMRNELKSFCQLRLKQLAQRGVVGEDKSDEIWKRFLAGDRQLLWGHVWLLVVLGDWMERNGAEVQ